MIKLVEVEPLVCSREPSPSEIFIVLLVLYFDLYLRAMLKFFRIYARSKIKKEQKNMFQDPPKRTPMGTFHWKGIRSNTRKCIPLYTTTFEIQTLHTIKFSLRIQISLLSLKNWEALTRIVDSVRFYNNTFIFK